METTKPEKVDAEPVTKTAEVVSSTPQETRPTRPTLPPEIREALDASWERDEEAYRYLGR